MQKCEKVPQKAITSTQGQTCSEGQRQTCSAGNRPSTDCTTSIQKMMATVLSVRVSAFTMITETAKPTAASSAINCPGCTAPVWGRTMIITPTSPSATAIVFQRPMRSRSTATASSAVQIGIVNSIATSCASGIIVNATNQPNWAA